MAQVRSRISAEEDDLLLLAGWGGEPKGQRPEYTVLGACDNDCNNVDVELIDMRTGGVVASDLLPDDYPVVSYTPTANGDYLARLILRTCTTAPCYTGMRLLTRPADSGGGK